MVLQLVIYILVFLHSLPGIFTYKVNSDTGHNVLHEILDNLEKLAVYSHEDDNAEDKPHPVKPHVFIGKDNFFFIRNARKNKDDDISPVYSFIKNRPSFKTIHYDDTIYKKKNGNVPANKANKNADEESEDDVGVSSKTVPIRSTGGKSTKYFDSLNSCFLGLKRNSELLNVLYSLPPDMKKMMRNGK